MKLISLVLAALIGWQANARCIPENNIVIPELAPTGISHKLFDSVVSAFEAHYGPVVASKGYKLVINRLWSDSTVNSDTTVEGRNWVINAYGGLARYPGMSVLGYITVLCHELGHHLGGAPKYSGWGDGWASVEGEADYWATLRCMKNLGYSSGYIVNGSVRLARVLADLGGEPMPSPNTPDPSVVSRTYEDHPASQCRLDTMLNGLHCTARGALSDIDPRVNTCYDYSSRIGVRPRCWFRP